MTQSGATGNIWGLHHNQWWSNSIGEWGGQGELTPPHIGLSQGSIQLMYFLQLVSQPQSSTFNSARCVGTASNTHFHSFLLYIWPSQTHSQELLLTRSKSSLWWKLILGGHRSSKQWPQTKHKVPLLLLVTSSAWSGLHWAVCWLPAAASQPEQQSRTIKPYKHKAGIVFWVISDYRIFNLCIWHNHCFIACVHF